MSDYQPTPPPATPYTGSSAPAQKSPVLSIISVVGGALSILTSFFFVGLLLGVAGLILGILGRRKEPASKGLWLTGIILSIIGVVISLIVIAFWIVVVIAAASQAGSTSP